MNKLMKQIVLTAACAVPLASNIVWADDPPLSDTDLPAGIPGQAGQMLVVMYVRGPAAKTELSLSEEQSAALQAFFQTAEPRMSEGRKELVRVARHHAEVAAARPLDEAALEESRAALRGAQDQIAALRAEQYQGVVGILSAAQLQTAIAKVREQLDWAK